MKANIFKNKIFAVLLTIILILSMPIYIIACNNAETDSYTDLSPLYDPEPGESELLEPDDAISIESVTVTVPVDRVAFDIRELTLKLGESAKLYPNIFPADATYSYAQFHSSNDQIVTVSNTGAVHAIGVGTAEITYTVDGVSASIPVTVEIPVVSFAISTDREFYAVGDKGILTVEFTPEDATNQTYEVRFSRYAKMLDDGNFQLNAAGVVMITVTLPNGMTESRRITVVDLEVLANDVFELTNIQRVNAGLPAFAQMESLSRAAEERAYEIIESFSHTRPDGRSFVTVFNQFRVPHTFAGENLGEGQRTAADVVADWMASQGHRENILNSRFIYIGIGVKIDSEGTLYWTQLFAD